MNKIKIKRMLVRLGKRAWSIVSKNLALKTLSLVFAVFLWSFVITTNPSITREKTLADVDISVTGQAVLSGRGLALLTDVTTIDPARVTIEAPQSSYTMVNDENVRVELDLSSIRDVGTRQVRLRANTVYGSVAQIWPEYVTVEVENQDQRYVPVNAVIKGDDEENYWYSVTRVNPSQVLVTGPESVVQLLSSAEVEIDASGKTSPISRVEDFALLDANENRLTEMLSASTNSISVGIDIYPKKKLPVSSQLDDLITGSPPAGFRVETVEITPDAVTVAGEKELLGELQSLTIMPVDVSDARRSFTAIARVKSIKGIKYMSIEDITVSVSIAEESLVKRFSNIAVQAVNQPDDCVVQLSTPRVDLRVSGPYSRVRSVTRGDVSVVVNLAGLGYGQYELPAEFSSNEYPGVTGEITPGTVTVVISENDQSQGR